MKMTSRKGLGGLLAGLVLALVSPIAAAYSITYTGGVYTLCTTGTFPSQTAFEASVDGCIPGTEEYELYKANVGGIEEGSFKDSYNTVFANTATQPADATIAYDGAPDAAISCALGCWLGVKDGNHNPTYYVFNISDWNGTSSIVMTGFWPGDGAISNVSIWTGTMTSNTSTTSNTNGSVPEPATGGLALLGVALLGASLWRRRRA